MKNEIFDFNRFLLALKKEFVENKKTYLLLLAGLYAGLTLLMVFGNLVVPQIDEQGKYVIYIIVWSLGAFIATISASLMFGKLRDKPKRISMLMNPASMLEKFLVNVLIYVVGIVIVYALAAQVADATRVLLMCILRPGAAVIGLIDFITSPISELIKVNPLLLTGLLLMSFFQVSVYCVGAVIWPKLSFIKTYAATYVIEMVLIILSIALYPIIGMSLIEAANYLSDHITENQILIAGNITLLIGTLAIFYWAYRLWLRRDVEKTTLL